MPIDRAACFPRWWRGCLRCRDRMPEPPVHRGPPARSRWYPGTRRGRGSRPPSLPGGRTSRRRAHCTPSSRPPTVERNAMRGSSGSATVEGGSASIGRPLRDLDPKVGATVPAQRALDQPRQLSMAWVVASSAMARPISAGRRDRPATSSRSATRASADLPALARVIARRWPPGEPRRARRRRAPPGAPSAQVATTDAEPSPTRRSMHRRAGDTPGAAAMSVRLSVR